MSQRNCPQCDSEWKVLYDPVKRTAGTFCPHVIAYVKHGGQTIMSQDAICPDCNGLMFAYVDRYDERFQYEVHDCPAPFTHDVDQGRPDERLYHPIGWTQGGAARVAAALVEAAKGVIKPAPVGDNINVGKDVSRADSPGQTEPIETLEHVQVALNDALRELRRAEGILRPTFSGTYIREAQMRATEAFMWTEKALRDQKT